MNTTIFHSRSYTKAELRPFINTTVQYTEDTTTCYGDCIVFASVGTEMMALVEVYNSKEYFSNHVVTVPSGYFVQCKKTALTKWINCKNILAKCCYIRHVNGLVHISVLCEAFEHN